MLNELVLLLLIVTYMRRLNQMHTGGKWSKDFLLKGKNIESDAIRKFAHANAASKRIGRID